MNLQRIQKLQQRPEPFTPGEPLFWDDPHISQQMLKAHLDHSNDLASRRSETIDRSVAWILGAVHLAPGSHVLDLGCGPGLYASRFAQGGFQVTGIDISRRSIDYAVQAARQQVLQMDFRCQDYLSLEDENLYDIALLIYGDFCPLSPGQRGQLLKNVRRALKRGGTFVLDVTTRENRIKHGMKNGWSIEENAFWKPGLHLALEQGFDYPDQDIYLDQVIVLDAEDNLSVYRMWFQDYTPESITRELEQGGFTVESLWNDLCGTPYSQGSEWIGVIARK